MKHVCLRTYQINAIYQHNKLHLKTETESSLRNVLFDERQDDV
jgi:hypothetical protein